MLAAEPYGGGQVLCWRLSLTVSVESYGVG